MNKNAAIDNNTNIAEERLKKLKAYFGYAEEGDIVPEEELICQGRSEG